MQQNYSKKIEPIQKASKNTASSVLDASSQSEALQRKADMANNAAQREEAPRPNNTGMPDNLKSGIESLSGFSMDDVRVHYNSSKPATVQALAYTQGTDIHVAPGQEKHLPHEAWHVAQQMAGRVSPTTNINGMPVNDNAGLEHEADVMGEKAVQCKNLKTRNDCNYEKKTLGRVSQLTTVYFGEEKKVIEEYGAFISLCQKRKQHISLGNKPRNPKEFDFKSWPPLKSAIKEKIIDKKIYEKKDEILEKCCAKANIAHRESVEQIVNALKEYKEKPPTAPSLVVKIPIEVTRWKNFIIEKRGTELECADSAELCAWDMYHHVEAASGTGTKYKIKINGKDETVFHYSQGEFGQYKKCCTVFFVCCGESRRKKIVGVGVHNSKTDTALYKLNWIDPSWIGVDPKKLHL